MDILTIYKKYLNAQTTIEEERWLSEALSTDCPPELLAKRDILLAMLPKSEPTLPKGFVAQFEKRLKGISYKKRDVLIRWIAGFSAAAIFAGVLFLFGKPYGIYDTPNNEVSQVKTNLHKKQKKRLPSDVNENSVVVRPTITHAKAQSERSPQIESVTQHTAITLQQTASFSEAEVEAAEAEAERVIEKMRINAEQSIAEANKDMLIESTEACIATYLADVEASLSLDVEAAEDCIRAADFNAKLVARN